MRIFAEEIQAEGADFDDIEFVDEDDIEDLDDFEYEVEEGE